MAEDNNFQSLIKFNGVSILPPCLNDVDVELMREWKKLAVFCEQHPKKGTVQQHLGRRKRGYVEGNEATSCKQGSVRSTLDSGVISEQASLNRTSSDVCAILNSLGNSSDEADDIAVPPLNFTRSTIVRLPALFVDNSSSPSSLSPIQTCIFASSRSDVSHCSAANFSELNLTGAAPVNITDISPSLQLGILDTDVGKTEHELPNSITGAQNREDNDSDLVYSSSSHQEDEDGRKEENDSDQSSRDDDDDDYDDVEIKTLNDHNGLHLLRGSEGLNCTFDSPSAFESAETRVALHQSRFDLSDGVSAHLHENLIRSGSTREYHFLLKQELVKHQQTQLARLLAQQTQEQANLMRLIRLQEEAFLSRIQAVDDEAQNGLGATSSEGQLESTTDTGNAAMTVEIAGKEENIDSVWSTANAASALGIVGNSATTLETVGNSSIAVGAAENTAATNEADVKNDFIYATETAADRLLSELGCAHLLADACRSVSEEKRAYWMLNSERNGETCSSRQSSSESNCSHNPIMFSIPLGRKRTKILRSTDVIYSPKEHSSQSLLVLDSMHGSFCRVSAVAKGFLTRKLMKSDRVQDLIRMIRDTADMILKLSQDISSSSMADQQLYCSLFSQLSSAMLDFHTIFFLISRKEQMQIIASSRFGKNKGTRSRLS